MKNKNIFRCNNCEYETVSWTGKCPNCNTWGSLKEIKMDNIKSSTGKNIEINGRASGPWR